MKNTKIEIEELLNKKAPTIEVAKLLKKEMKTYLESVEDIYVSSGGKDFLVKHTKKLDTILKIIFKVAKREMFGDYVPMTNSIPIALIALGSYGREQLCLYSDIDIMIVYKDIKGYNSKEIIEKVLYLLWDSGLKVGHRVHTVEELLEVSKTDITIKTALIESRFIDGSSFIWMETQNMLQKIRNFEVLKYINQKLHEQEVQHKKYPLTMEPNLKEGVGGFRDANLVFWIGNILYNTHNIKSLPSFIIEENDYKPFRIALEFLFRVRVALHIASKKKQDSLRLDLIPKVSELLGYQKDKDGHIKFSKKVIASLKTVRLYSTIWLEILTRDYRNKETCPQIGFTQKEAFEFEYLIKLLNKRASAPFEPHPTCLKALISSKKPQRLTPSLYKAVGEIFEQTYSYATIQTLSYANLLDYTIYPMRKIMNLPQFDGYHQYAVDIHSIYTLYYIENIDDEFIKSLFDSLTNEEQKMLKIVTFLHDSGKGRKRDHHFIGASLFKVFADKIDINYSLIKEGETLINYHTLMSNVAQREDLYSENTILAFASHFPSKKLLKMIYILTYADMSAVGKGIYNNFNSKLIKILYIQSLDVLENKAMLDEAGKRAKKELSLKKYPPFLKFKRLQQKKILEIPSNLLFLRYKAKNIVGIVDRAFNTEELSFIVNNNEYLTIEIIRKDFFNLSYLLHKLSQLEVLNMDICKLFDNYKYFKIDFSKTVDNDDIPLIKRYIKEAFNNHKKIPMPKIKIIEDDILIDCNHSRSYAVMNLKAKDQKGLLLYILKIFDELGVDIVTAKVHTLKNRVRDMFLIEKNEELCHNTNLIIEKIIQGV